MNVLAAMGTSTMALAVCGALIVLLKTWHGWRLGPVRQLVSLGALVVAAGFGILGARASAEMLKAVLPYPRQMLMVVGGMLIGLVVFAIITVVGGILFKKTGDQSVGAVRIAYGLTGAALGAVFGLVMVWSLALALRLLGTLASMALALEKNPQLTTEGTPRAHVIATNLATLRRDMEHSAAGRVVRWTDPLPESTYSTLRKVALVVANQKSTEALLSHPKIRPVMKHPKVAPLLNDPEVIKAITERRYLSLLSNPKLVAAADDPEVAAQLRAIDFEKALDYALGAGSKQ